MTVQNDWKLLLRTGFGNIFDVGYGWDYDGMCLLAAAVNAETPTERRTAWAAVKDFCMSKSGSIPAC